MRLLLLLILMHAVFSVKAQVEVTIEGTYVDDGALGLVVNITNIAPGPATVQISDSKTLLQLAYAQSYLDSALQSKVPVTFVLFYAEGKLIDEPVMICDHRLPGIMNVLLEAQEEFPVNIESRCLSGSVLGLLNNTKKVEAELYLLYRLDGKAQVHIARSPKKTIRVKK
jgi:hypothetical protein